MYLPDILQIRDINYSSIYIFFTYEFVYIIRWKSTNRNDIVIIIWINHWPLKSKQPRIWHYHYRNSICKCKHCRCGNYNIYTFKRSVRLIYYFNNLDMWSSNITPYTIYVSFFADSN